MIHPAPPRNTIQAHFPDGRAFEGPLGTTAEAFIEAAQPQHNGVVVAALLNGKLRELSTPLFADTEIEPVDSADSDGTRIYRRSLCFLMIAAASQLFPDDVINIQHSMPFGGYYCEREGRPPYSAEELARLKQRMDELVAEDHVIGKQQIPLDEAVRLFEAIGDQEKAALFAKRRKQYLTVYRLNGVRDYFHGFMVPRTRYLNHFDLCEYSRGFILRFPRRTSPDQLQPFEDEPRLAHIFQAYDRWLDLVGVPSVNALNQAIASNRIQEVILIAEALHQRQLASIANNIERERGRIRLVLISGPTSAGKTTFSKRLAVQLLARGIQPVAIAMDNYFVNREDTPRDEDGQYDFEALEAVDLELFQDHLRRLLAGEEITLPRFDFRSGTRAWADRLSIEPHQVILIEGIHGLNPRLLGGISADFAYRIFISAFTQLNLDKHNRIPTTDTRKLRRIVRDYQHRGHNAAATIRMWPRVRRGEKRHIFPNQHHADVFFNSALAYELAAIKQLAQPILLQVEPDTPERVEANRLLAFLQWFDPIAPEALAMIPNDSLLREFIGGSIMENFQPWIT